jgi:hypothetical protein
LLGANCQGKKAQEKGAKAAVTNTISIAGSSLEKSVSNKGRKILRAKNACDGQNYLYISTFLY